MEVKSDYKELFKIAERKRKLRIARCVKSGVHSFSPLRRTAKLTGTINWICLRCGNIISSS